MKVDHPLAPRLYDLISARAILRGDFALSSGGRSDHLFRLSNVTMLPEGANLVGQIMVDWMEERKISCIGGMERGAIPIVNSCGAVGHARGIRIEPFYFRKEPKRHGHGDEVEGYIGEGEVALADDVVTSGRSIMDTAIRVLARDHRQKIRSAFAIVDREEGGSENLRPLSIELQSIFTKSDFGF